MPSQSSLSIQYSNGSKPEGSRRSEKNPDSSATARTSFQSSLKESIIDVYERSDINVAVPDERTGVDRRMSPSRRRSSPEPAPLQSDNKVKDVSIYSTKLKTNQIYGNTEKTTPAFFSQSQKIGSLLDTWA